MTAVIEFDNTSVFQGFTVNYKISEGLSKSIVIAECYRRLENILDSLNLQKLKEISKDKCFIIKSSINDLNDGDKVFISVV